MPSDPQQNLPDEQPYNPEEVLPDQAFYPGYGEILDNSYDGLPYVGFSESFGPTNYSPVDPSRSYTAEPNYSPVDPGRGYIGESFNPANPPIHYPEYTSSSFSNLGQPALSGDNLLPPLPFTFDSQGTSIAHLYTRLMPRQPTEIPERDGRRVMQVSTIFISLLLADSFCE